MDDCNCSFSTISQLRLYFVKHNGRIKHILYADGASAFLFTQHVSLYVFS